MTEQHRTWPKTVAVALTGASGTQYGLRLTECLIGAGVRVYLMVTQAAQVVLKMEADVDVPARPAEAEAFFSERFDTLPGWPSRTSRSRSGRNGYLPSPGRARSFMPPLR